MQTTNCGSHLQTCALKGLMADLALNADDDREQLSHDAWGAMLDEAVESGDEFFDYDGPLTWA